jgi:GH24 family phage-related lysozyme (muramidase)
MRKWILLTLILLLQLPSYAARSMTSLMELPPFERAVLVIKHYETLHKPQHWPYIGYGHQVQPGEPYRKGVQLTEQQADALLRKDLRKFCALFRDYGPDSTLVAVLAYNCGPRKVMQSSIARKLRAGERDIYHDYLSFCRYKGKMHQGIRRRRWVEFQLLYSEK